MYRPRYVTGTEVEQGAAEDQSPGAIIGYVDSRLECEKGG